MTKNDIAKRISEETGIDRKTALTVVKALIATIKGSLAEGENVYLRGFGSFIIKERAIKAARNISKNTTIIIPKHNIPFFKPSKDFKELL